jgi:hydroxypyruvate isomerase
MEGDLARRFETLLPIIGHVQIAGVPERGAPDEGEVDLGWLLARMKRLGWDRPVGAEYRPAGGQTEASLGWLSRFRAI